MSFGGNERRGKLGTKDRKRDQGLLSRMTKMFKRLKPGDEAGVESF
jgi:hypothetical protein